MADVFISHASEDTAAVARPLADALVAQGWTVWLDEDMLQIGDRLSGAIGAGLADCRYGVVILSPSFFAKAWPRRELETLIAREAADRQDLLLPVWHGVTAAEIAGRSELLADRKGIMTAGGLEPVVAAIGRVLRRAPPNNVPALLDVTIGRDDQIAAVRAALQQARLVTIHGGAGVGKSRLAIAVANAALTEPLWGVWFVELAALARADAANRDLVPAEVGRAIGMAERPGTPPLEALAAYLAPGKYLLVLDNCEHVVDPCRDLIDHLVAACPGVRVLTTSRVPLRALAGAGERVYDLHALSTVAETDDVERVRSCDAVRLFEIRAQMRWSSFRVDATNALAISRLCRALDGNPLAIEVAAARLSVRSLEQMVDEVHDFVGGLGNVASGTLRQWDRLTAAIEWSVNLLSDDHRGCARAMAVFEGGWTEDAAGPVWLGADSTGAVTDALQTLVDHSLLETRDVGQRKRFRYLEAVRQYLRGTLTPEELPDYQRRHADWFCRLAEQGAPFLLQAGQREWLDRLQADDDNFRAAARWAITGGHAELALRFLAALWRFAEIRGYFDEWRTTAQRVLAMPEAKAFPALQSKVHSGAGMLAYRLADFDGAEPHFASSLAIEKRQRSKPGMANALNDLGNVAMMRGHYDEARRRFGESMAIETALNNARGVAVAKNNLATVALAEGQTDDAIALFAESLRGFRAIDYVRESAFPLLGLAVAHIVQGDVDAARSFIDDCLRVRREVGDQKGIADATRALGWLEFEAGHDAAGLEHVREAATVAHALKDRRGIADSLSLVAMWCGRQQQHERVVRLSAASHEIRQGFSYARPPLLISRREDALARAKEALGEAVFKRCWLQGTLLTMDQAVEVALKMGSGVI